MDGRDGWENNLLAFMSLNHSKQLDEFRDAIVRVKNTVYLQYDTVSIKFGFNVLEYLLGF